MIDEASARVEHVFKLLVTGPFAAGKTTLIQSVSQTPVVDTDVVTTGAESAVKSRTTVAMDFGTYVVEGGDVRLLMFGTPGQPRFWFMTDILKGQVDAVIYVVDAEATHTHAEAGAAMRALLRDLRVPLVVAVNREDEPEAATMI
ncbi:MAG TPA: ATP/GTP-binding protein, partial [Ilumatobacter sp.]